MRYTNTCKYGVSMMGWWHMCSCAHCS